MIKKIAVLGAGTMGHGIAEAFAMCGYDVHLYETDAKRLATVKGEIKQELDLLAEEDLHSLRQCPNNSPENIVIC